MRVLILSRDSKSFVRFRNKLIVEGHSVVMFEALVDFASMLSFVSPDVLIVDTTSPDAASVLNQLGGIKACTIALTAPDDPTRFVPHANYVLRKPVRTKQLFKIIAPLRALAANGGLSSGTFKDAKLNPQTRGFQPYGDEREIVLTPIEFSVLEYLMAHRNRPIDRTELASKCCSSTDERVVDVHVFNIRRKLGAAGDQIKAVRRQGYVFVDFTSAISPSG